MLEVKQTVRKGGAEGRGRAICAGDVAGTAMPGLGMAGASNTAGGRLSYSKIVGMEGKGG